MILELVHNLALLLSIAVVYELLRIRVMSYLWWHKLVTGLLFGAATVAGMLTPVVLASGVIYDGRSVILAVAGYLGGPAVAGLSAIVAGAFRIWLGGAGTAAGVATVASAAAIGTASWYLRRRDSRWEGTLRVWGIGVAVHVAMLLSQLLIPRILYDQLLTTVAAPVLLLYPLAFLLTVQVVTTFERRRDARTALSESESRYRSLFESGYAPMLIVDPQDGRIHDANTAAERFYGWSRAELCEMKVSDINVLSPEEVKREMELARRSERNYFQFRHRLRDGSVRDVAVYSGTVTMDGNPRLLSIVRDITQELAAQRELYLLRYSTENSIIGVFRIREPDGRIVYANRSARETLGYSAEELSSMTILDIDSTFTEETWREHREETRRLSGKTFETMHRTKNGKEFPVEVTVTYLSYEGEEFTFSFARDITRRKEAETRLHESLGHKETLLREVHHRVRNNLAVITGLIRLQLHEVGAEEGASLSKTRDRIEVMALIHNMLYTEQALARVNFAEVVRHLVYQLQERYDAEHHVHVTPALEDVWLGVDTALPLGLITNEAVTNGFAHAFGDGGGGELRVSLAREATETDAAAPAHGGTLHRSAASCTLVVEDDGGGLPADCHPEEPETLGFRIMQVLSQQIHARLEVRNATGTRVSVDLPCWQ